MAPRHRWHLDNDQARGRRHREGCRMTTYSLALRRDHAEQLRSHLVRKDGREHAAYILCNKAEARQEPWERQAHVTYLCTKVIPVPDDQVIESEVNLITWRTASFVAVLKEAASNDQIVG